MRIDLSDKTILITGGLGAIAEYVARALIDAGAVVVLTDLLPAAEANQVIADRGYATDRCAYFTMDVCDATAVSTVVDKAFEQYPQINVALGHAGGTGIEFFRDTTDESFEQIVRFNFLAQTYLARAVLRHWQEQHVKGHMIFTSSYVSRIPYPGIAAYTAAKSALDMFAKTLALEYSNSQIRFNLISPGNVAAGSSKVVYETDPAYRQAVDRMSPLGYRNTPEAIANAFLYLCSPLADEVDGHILNVDAGVGLPKVY